jgi:hypothetical protein
MTRSPSSASISMKMRVKKCLGSHAQSGPKGPRGEEPMPHKFKVGDIVSVQPAMSRNIPGGVYEVTQRLPETGGEFHYRIKSVNEPHERVVRESELTKT